MLKGIPQSVLLSLILRRAADGGPLTPLLTHFSFSVIFVRAIPQPTNRQTDEARRGPGHNKAG